MSMQEVILTPKNVLHKDGEVFYFPDFFSQEESDNFFKSLLENVIWQQDSIKLFGKTMNLPRLTAWYGCEGLTYKYSNILMHPHPWTQDLLTIKDKIETQAKVHFTNVLLNLYRNGKDSMAWHADDEPELGKNPVIGSVSFGAAREIQFKHIQDKTIKKLVLTHGSFLLMQGETQHKWKHQIPKTKAVSSPRINLTFRIVV